MNNYLIKNFPLAVRSEWMIDEQVADLVKTALPEILKFGKSLGKNDLKETVLRSQIKEPVKEVYTTPLFKPDFCEMLLDEVENMKLYFNFEPNSEEDELYFYL